MCARKKTEAYILHWELSLIIDHSCILSPPCAGRSEPDLGWLPFFLPPFALSSLFRFLLVSFQPTGPSSRLVVPSSVLFPPTFVQSANHVLREPGPGKHGHGETRTTPHHWREWIRAQLMPRRTISYHLTYKFYRSESRNLHPRVPHGR